jgi:hypothetical protein
VLEERSYFSVLDNFLWEKCDEFISAEWSYEVDEERYFIKKKAPPIKFGKSQKNFFPMMSTKK